MQTMRAAYLLQGFYLLLLCFCNGQVPQQQAIRSGPVAGQAAQGRQLPAPGAAVRQLPGLQVWAIYNISSFPRQASAIFTLTDTLQGPKHVRKRMFRKIRRHWRRYIPNNSSVTNFSTAQAMGSWAAQLAALWLQQATLDNPSYACSQFAVPPPPYDDFAWCDLTDGLISGVLVGMSLPPLLTRVSQAARLRQLQLQAARPGQTPLQGARPGQTPLQGARPGQTLLQGKRPGQTPLQGARPGQAPPQTGGAGQAGLGRPVAGLGTGRQGGRPGLGAGGGMGGARGAMGGGARQGAMGRGGAMAGGRPMLPGNRMGLGMRGRGMGGWGVGRRMGGGPGGGMRGGMRRGMGGGMGAQARGRANLMLAALMGHARKCKTDKSAVGLSAPLRTPGASNGPGPEGLFPVPTIIGVCCQKSGTSTLFRYLDMLASVQGSKAEIGRKEARFFDSPIATWATSPSPSRDANAPGISALPNATSPDFLYSIYVGRWLQQQAGPGLTGGPDAGGAAATNSAATPGGPGATVNPNFCTAALAPPKPPAGAPAPLTSVRGENPPAAGAAPLRKQLFSPYITFEFTPRYLLDPSAPWAMQRVLPKPRGPLLLVVLRDPIQRAISGWFHVARGRNPSHLSLSDRAAVDLQWELDTVIRQCYARSYAASWGGKAPAQPTPAGAAIAPFPVPVPGLLPDARSCAEAGDGWKRKKALAECMQAAVKAEAAAPGGLRSANWNYDSWLVRGLYTDQIRNLLCAGFGPSQILIVTLKEIANDPGAVLQRIARAVDRNEIVADKSVFESERLLKEEVHVLSGMMKTPHEDVKLPPSLHTRLKNMYAADVKDLLSLVTKKNGFLVSENMLASEFAEILKP
eukprot:jgi/Mesvir1/21600/Mv25019-RA.1